MELDQVPALVVHQKHTIEAVVDRFKVRGDIALRLSESVETALRLSYGTVRIAPMSGDADTIVDTNIGINSDPQSEIVFSAKFACPLCGYSLTELEPRLFSFNNPIGACSTCDGLGVKQFFDQTRVVAHPEISLAGGAVRGWDRRNAYYFQMISSLADHYGFDIETPFEELSAEHQGLTLHGSGE